MNEIKSAVYGETEAGRSAKVRQILENIRQTLSTINLDVAELLVEAQDKNYLQEWQTTLKDFIEDNLDISAREAFYLMDVIRGHRKLGYERAEVEHIGISKLKQIFRLNPEAVFFNHETQENEKIADHIRRLITMAPSTGLKAIVAEVDRLRGKVQDDATWWNVQLSRDAKEKVVIPGLDAFRRYLGSKGTREKEGSSEYSDGFVVECIFAEILSGAPQEGEGIKDEVVDEEEYYEDAAA